LGIMTKKVVNCTLRFHCARIITQKRSCPKLIQNVVPKLKIQTSIKINSNVDQS
jgi:hypothetical protein